MSPEHIALWNAYTALTPEERGRSQKDIAGLVIATVNSTLAIEGRPPMKESTLKNGYLSTIKQMYDRDPNPQPKQMPGFANPAQAQAQAQARFQAQAQVRQAGMGMPMPAPMPAHVVGRPWAQQGPAQTADRVWMGVPVAPQAAHVPRPDRVAEWVYATRDVAEPVSPTALSPNSVASAAGLASPGARSASSDSSRDSGVGADPRHMTYPTSNVRGEARNSNNQRGM